VFLRRHHHGRDGRGFRSFLAAAMFSSAWSARRPGLIDRFAVFKIASIASANALPTGVCSDAIT
jgi:hypothetical protein